MGSAPARYVGHRRSEARTTRVLAAYVCRICEIEGQEPEVSPGCVFCWNCENEAVITARIVIYTA